MEIHSKKGKINPTHWKIQEYEKSLKNKNKIMGEKVRFLQLARLLFC